jgi:hypothetical protein
LIRNNKSIICKIIIFNEERERGRELINGANKYERCSSTPKIIVRKGRKVK